MRSPKPRPRRRAQTAWRRRGGPQNATCAAFALVLAGCGADRPEPKRVVDIEPVVEPRVRPERKGPFTDPNTTAPGPRSGPQQGAEELATTLRDAGRQAKLGKSDVAIQTLRSCANKVPQSIECEAEVALLMFAHGRHKAHAKYFMAQAAKADPATASTELYRRLAERAITSAQFDSARLSYGILVARDEATVDDLLAYGRAMQADPNYRDEAVDIYARAYARDPKRHEVLKTQGTLLAQSGAHERAAELFETYRDVGDLDDKAKAAIDSRIAQLKALADSEAPTAEQPDETPTKAPTKTPTQTPTQAPSGAEQAPK